MNLVLLLNTYKLIYKALTVDNYQSHLYITVYSHPFKLKITQKKAYEDKSILNTIMGVKRINEALCEKLMKTLLFTL